MVSHWALQSNVNLMEVFLLHACCAAVLPTDAHAYRYCSSPFDTIVASVQVGDRVIEVNGVAVNGKQPADIIRLLSNSDKSVTFKVRRCESSYSNHMPYSVDTNGIGA